MALTYKPLPYVLSDVVDIVKSKMIDSDINYMFGTVTEVLNNLKSMSESKTAKNQRYPLIWLVIPDSIEEKVDNTKANRRSIDDVTIIIMNRTKKDYTTKERYDINIIPILRPIYEMLMFYIEKSGRFASNDKFSHTYTENLQWGKDGLYGVAGSILNDYVDAITIEGLSLRIIENC